MREHDHLANPIIQALHFLDCGQSPVFIQARHGIIDHHELMRYACVLIEGGEEERQRGRGRQRDWQRRVAYGGQ